MHRELTFSYYQHKKDTKTQIITRPWVDWVSVFTNHKIRGAPEDTNSEAALNAAKDGPALILGVVDGDRCSENVTEIHALSLDIDNSSAEEIAEVLQKLDSYEYIAHTTHKHGAGVVSKPRIRVILPLRTPLPISEYPSAWKRLYEHTQRVNDKSTKNADRLNFLPSTFDAGKAHAEHHEGRWLSVDGLPDISNKIEDLDRLMQEDEDNQQLTKIVSGLRGLNKSHELKDAALALTRGESFAEAPHRHQTILKLTIFLARKYPKIQDSIVKKVFSESIREMSKQSDPPTMNEVLDAFRGARTKIQQSAPDSSETYSPEVLRHIANIQKCSVQDLQHRWIIQKDGGGWILGQDGGYQGFFSWRDFPLAIRKFLKHAPVDLFEPTQNGYKRRPVEDLTAQYGDIAYKIISDMSAEYTTFNPDNHIIYESVSKLRKLEPVFDPQIDRWLQLLFGASYDKGIDWLSVCPDLTKQLCAIYFSGSKDSGKTAFALGLAKLWTEGAPGDAALVLSDFNEELLRCPLVLADEELPKNIGRSSVTTKLRAMLSTTSRSLARKHMPPSELEGAIRLVLTANNDFLLSTNELHTANDMEAIAQRFMYVNTGTEASRYLETMDRATTGRWIDFGIAEHALWLSKNHEVKNPGNRFAVEGDIAEMHRLLLVGAPWSSLICEWLVRYLLNPNPFDTECTGLIQRKDGRLYVNNQALVMSWDTYLGKARERPDTRKIGTALNTICYDPKKRLQMRHGEKRIWYKEVDVSHLKHWMAEYNIGDEETIKKSLNTSVADMGVDGNKIVPMSREGRGMVEEY